MPTHRVRRLDSLQLRDLIWEQPSLDTRRRRLKKALIETGDN